MGPLRPVVLAFGLGALCALAGCTGGQSGTETPHPTDGPDSGTRDLGVPEGGQTIDTKATVQVCACFATSDRAVLVRGMLEAIDECTARVRVEQMLSPANPALAIGEVVGGALPGYGGCEENIDLHPGDDVLLVYTRGTQDGESCVEYADCIQTQCADPAAVELDGGVDCFAACVQDTRVACAGHAEEARLGGQLVVARYGDTLLFGREASDAAISLPKSELDRLLDPVACSDWFFQHAIGASPDAAVEPAHCVP